MLRVLILLSVLGWPALSSALSAGPSWLEPYALLREAYARRDAERASQAYANDALLSFEYRDAAPEHHAGRPAIQAAFERLFAPWAADPVDLNFRITKRKGDAHAGWYRLRVGSQSACGRFSVTLRREAGRMRFASDRSTDARCAEFEEAAAPLALDEDATALDPVFHDALMGRYQGPSGSVWRITRSAWRLQWEDSASGEVRSLARIDGSTWQVRSRFASGTQAGVLQFGPAGPDGRRPWLQHGPWRAERLPDTTPSVVPVRFASADGTELSGEIRLPSGAGPHAGVVLLHGSGPQDRHGYAGLLRRLGDAFVEGGVAVLSFDKRGSGSSGGDGARASFARLAEDAAAAMARLAAQPSVAPSRVGLAGSSQAGWVAAQAVDAGVRPAHVLLLGAAGAGVTVIEQHRWHTRQQLQCRGIRDAQAVLDQHEAFFALQRELAPPAAPGPQPRAGDDRRAELRAQFERLTARLGLRGRAWAMPDPERADPAAWFRVLELDFDAASVWAARSIPLAVVLFEQDDATPSVQVANRLQGLAHVRLERLEGANHLGMLAEDLCRPIESARRWHPALWPWVERWARGR